MKRMTDMRKEDTCYRIVQTFYRNEVRCCNLLPPLAIP